MSTFYPSGRTAVEIAASLAAAVRSGRLAAGDPVPPVRALAARLAVNPNTVASAYGRLRDAGLLVTGGRRGTRVAAPPERTDWLPAPPAGLRDLASGNVDAALLPRLDPAWLAPFALTGYDAEHDDPDLLACAREWLATQGVPAEAMGVFSGTLDAIERALRARVPAGGLVWVEDPGWPPLFALLRSLRLRMEPLPALAPGVDAVRAAGTAAPAAIIVTPRAQNPTGACLDASRLKRLCALARRAEALLVLDDYWGPLGAPAAALPRELPPDWLFVASTSKFVGPDLRVAVAVGPAALIDDLKRQQAVGPRWVSLLLQRLAAALWRSSAASGVLRRARRAYAQRRAAVTKALRARGIDMPKDGEGLHVWVPVLDEAAVTQAMAARGWAVQAGAPFRLRSPPAIRISLGNLEAKDAQPLAGDLAAVLSAPRRVMI